MFNTIQNVPKTLRNLVLGGECFPYKNELIKKIIDENKITVFNIYGITELSAWATCHLVTRDDLK